MEQLVSAQLAENRSLELPRVADRFREANIEWQSIQHAMDAGAFAAGLPNGMLMSSRASRQPESALLAPTRDVIQKLENSQDHRDSSAPRPITFACTYAREAQYLTDDRDSRDCRYLSGARAVNGAHVYCGSIDAAIRRATAYASHSDVLCYYSSRLDLTEAEYFANAIRSTWPSKRLALGFSPMSQDSQEKKLVIANLEKRLLRLGYEYYFLIELGTIFFPAFPQAESWILFDDIAELPNPSLSSDRLLFSSEGFNPRYVCRDGEVQGCD